MYAYNNRYFRLSAFGLVCFCFALFAISSDVMAQQFGAVRGATIDNVYRPAASASGSAYRFAANDPRVTFSGSASSYPSPKGIVGKTYPLARWSPLAMQALRRVPLAMSVFYAADQVCQVYSCSTPYGADITVLGNPDGFGYSSEQLGTRLPGSFHGYCPSNQTPSVACSYAHLSESAINTLNSNLAITFAYGNPVTTYLEARPTTNPYQYTFYVRAIATNEPYDCPTGYIQDMGCVPILEDYEIPFDESLFADATPSPNISPEAAPLNDALWDLLNENRVATEIDLNFDNVEDTKTRTILRPAPEVDQVEETIRTYSYPVTENATLSPRVNPVLSETVNLYEGGNLISSVTTTEAVESVGAGTSSLTDCAFMPTVCEFMEWVQSYEDDQEPNYADLINDGGEVVDYDFNAPVAGCPAPEAIEITFLNSSVVFDYAPICEVASYIRYLLLIAASLLSSFMIARSVK